MKKSLTLILASILISSSLCSCTAYIDDLARELEDSKSLKFERIEDEPPSMYQAEIEITDKPNYYTDKKGGIADISPMKPASDEIHMSESELNSKEEFYSNEESIAYEHFTQHDQTTVITQSILLPIDGHINLTLSPGVSHWYTEIDLNPDGSFTGGFYNHFIMEMGEDHENGTMEICEFSGRFTNIQKLSDTEYSMTLTEFSKKQYGNDSWIENDIKYVPVDTIQLGFDSTENVEYRFYLPQHSSSDIPEGCLDWIFRTNSDGTLGWTALCDIKDNYAFITR